MDRKPLNPQQFRQLCGGTLAQRTAAFALLVEYGLARIVPADNDEGAEIEYIDREHPCVRLYAETRSRQGVT